MVGSLVTLVLIATIGSILYTFIPIIYALVKKDKPASSPGIIRAMLALALVGGLIILTGASLNGHDSQATNLLIGGVVASASAAVAFYFASRSAQEARQDLLNAALGTETVPTLVGLSVAQAQVALSNTSLKLILPTPPPAGNIATQSIQPGTTVVKGTAISVM